MNTGRIITTALAASILAIPAMAEAPGYFKVPGTETTLKVYGRAQTWAFYNVTPGEFDGATGVHQSNNEKNTVWSKTQARVGFTSTTPSSFGDVNVKLEYQAESNSTSNSGSLNLRHAYGEFAGVLIGQTDSLFSHWHNCPGYLDTWHPDFNGTSRARQIRYTLTPSKEIKVALSMEQDYTSGDSTKLAPTMVGAFQYAGDWGNVTATVGYQRIRDWDKVGTTTSTAKGTGTSFAVSGAWNITANDNLVARVINGGGQHGTWADGFIIDPANDTKYKFYKTTSMDLGYAHTWNDQFTSNIGVGVIEQKKKENLGKEKYTTTEFFANTTWNVTKNCQFGAEYFHANVKAGTDSTQFTKDDGTATKKLMNNGFNLMFTYNLF